MCIIRTTFIKGRDGDHSQCFGHQFITLCLKYGTWVTFFQIFEIIKDVLRMEVPKIAGNFLRTKEFKIVSRDLRELKEDIVGESPRM